MWQPGVTRRRQQAALAQMVQAATRSESYQAPWKASPQVWQHFASEADILCTLQQQWRSALAGAVYVAIDSGEGDLHRDVLGAFTKMRRRHHGLRRILEANADHPAIAAAMRKERALLAPFTELLEDAATAA